MDVLVEIRWAIYSGLVLAIVFFVWGYVQGYWRAEHVIRSQYLGIRVDDDE